MMAEIYDINAIKGDTVRFSYYFTNTGGSAYNFVGSTLYFQTRVGYYPATLISSYSKYVESNDVLQEPQGFTGGISSATGGTVMMCIGYTYSSNLNIERLCRYDLKIEQGSNKDLLTLLQGTIIVTPEVTKI